MPRRVLRRIEEARWQDRGNLLKSKDLDGVAAPAAKRKQRGRSKSRGQDDANKAAPAAKPKGRTDKPPAARAPSGGAADDREACFFHNNGGAIVARSAVSSFPGPRGKD